jgi:hypothetical protein
MGLSSCTHECGVATLVSAWALGGYRHSVACKVIGR